jgi:hypothetical protein
MNLSDCRFYHHGYALSFSVFSDVPALCRFINHLEFFEELRGFSGGIDVYEVQPKADAHWVVIVEKRYQERGDQQEKKYRVFVRHGHEYRESHNANVEAFVKEHIKSTIRGLERAS